MPLRPSQLAGRIAFEKTLESSRKRRSAGYTCNEILLDMQGINNDVTIRHWRVDVGYCNEVVSTTELRKQPAKTTLIGLLLRRGPCTLVVMRMIVC
jgi:hypothetical protein